MTKRILSALFTALLLATPGLFAQTLTQANSAPVVGQTSTYTALSLPFANSFTERQAGMGITWDLSGVSTGGTNATTYQAASTGSVASQYPNANIVIGSAGSTTELYYNINASGWSIEGSYGSTSGQQQFSSDPREFMVYPFAFGDSENYTFDGTFDNFITPLIPRGGTQKVECDGVGDLILPTGTVENCIRVLATSDYDDDLGIISLNYIDSIWLWFRPGTMDIIASVTMFYVDGFFAGGAGTMRAASEIMPTTGGIAPGFEAAHAVTLAPNPAIDRIHLSGAKMGEVVSLFGMDGRLLQRWVLGQNDPWLNLPQGISSGSYALRLEGENGIQRHTLLVR